MKDTAICAICGGEYTEKAHVKPKCTFNGDTDDAYLNIIPLCPSHHIAFDEGKIGIKLDRTIFFILEKNGKVHECSPKIPINKVREKYIREKNEYCHFKIQIKLGIVRNY